MASSRRSRHLAGIDPNDVYLNPDIRESDAEALERHRMFYDAAFATLSPTGQLVKAGVGAGVLTGLVLSFGLALFLAALVNFEVVVLGIAPLSWGAPTKPAWIGLLRPAWASLVLVPWFAVAGLVGALLRRWGHQHYKTLRYYFMPTAPWADLVGFWLCMVVALWFGFWMAGLLRPDDDMLGVILYMGGAGGTLSWPLYRIWLYIYLVLLHRISSVPDEQVQALIVAQLGPPDTGPALPKWREHFQTLFEARKGRQSHAQPPSRSR